MRWTAIMSVGIIGTSLFMTMTVGAQDKLTIDGTATYRERMALPPDAVFEAALEDVSRADAAVQVLGLARMEKPGNPPFHFTISYDPAQIMANHTYAIRARVSVNGKLLFTTDQRYQVLTQGHGSEIGMMMLRRVSASSVATESAAGTVPLRGTYWKLVQLGEKQLTSADQQREANLVFRAKDDRVTGSGGCNRLTGTYNADGHALRFNGIASTQMACMHGMETETTFLSALEKVRTWKISNQQLDLYDSGDKLPARFSAQAAQ